MDTSLIPLSSRLPLAMLCPPIESKGAKIALVVTALAMVGVSLFMSMPRAWRVSRHLGAGAAFTRSDGESWSSRADGRDREGLSAEGHSGVGEATVWTLALWVLFGCFFFGVFRLANSAFLPRDPLATVRGIHSIGLLVPAMLTGLAFAQEFATLALVRRWDSRKLFETLCTSIHRPGTRSETRNVKQDTAAAICVCVVLVVFTLGLLPGYAIVRADSLIFRSPVMSHATVYRFSEVKTLTRPQFGKLRMTQFSMHDGTTVTPRNSLADISAAEDLQLCKTAWAQMRQGGESPCERPK